jgi:hypothetical protein
MQALPEGTRIIHDRLGRGQILESNQNHTLINFETHGYMRFNTCFLEVLVLRAPAGHWPPATPEKLP